MTQTEVVIEVKNLVKYFPITEGIVRQKLVGNIHAVDDISFKVYKGETLGLVGESGCGKTTTGRMLLRLLKPTSGEILINNQNITEIGKKFSRIGYIWCFLTIISTILFFILSVIIPLNHTYLVSATNYYVLNGAYLLDAESGEFIYRGFDFLSRYKPDLAFFFAILFLWTIVFLFTGIFALISSLLPPIHHIFNKKPPDFPFVKVGMIIGLSGSMVAWIVMIIISFFDMEPIRDEFGEFIRMQGYSINFFNLAISSLGWAVFLAGAVLWARVERRDIQKKMLHDFRKSIQMIFQDPYSSLNPRMTVFDIISEGMDIYGLATSLREKEEKVLILMDHVGLAPFHIYRYPHEFSGGQRQRIGIARALSVNPQIIVADEPVSALDVSIRAQILNLLDDLQKDFELTYIIVAHDLSVIRHVSDRVAVMYVGKFVEIAETNKLFSHAMHPYTQALMSAVPLPDPTAKMEAIILKGDVPTPFNPEPGCRFKDRCIYAKKKCNEEPLLEEKTPNHYVACWFPL